MKKGIVNLAVVPQRLAPSDSAEMVSQLLFGDIVNIVDEHEGWFLVVNCYDDYEGWVDTKQISVSNVYIPSASDGYISGFNAFNTLIKEDGTFIYIPPACSLPGYQHGQCDIGAEKFEVDCEVLKMSDVSLNDLLQNSLFYLNAPYLWGGKAHYGIDCSGFTQMLFKSMGLRLKRDACKQAEQGILIDFFQEARAGDLAFFDNEEGKIIHVGMLLNDGKIIHASGKVRIDDIDSEGIIHSKSAKRSHNLRIIKRLV